jgi:predicted enzyme related to lactoylglutathione lyase
MSKAKLIGIAPQLVVHDVVKAAEYYCNVLGFTLINYFMDPPVYAMVKRDGCQLHFGKADGDTVHPNSQVRGISTDFVIWVPEIEAFFEEVKAKGADIEQQIVMRSYGREFIIRDCNGYRIMVCD